jgi:hypothetical protein
VRPAARARTGVAAARGTKHAIGAVCSQPERTQPRVHKQAVSGHAHKAAAAAAPQDALHGIDTGTTVPWHTCLHAQHTEQCRGPSTPARQQPCTSRHCRLQSNKYTCTSQQTLRVTTRRRAALPPTQTRHSLSTAALHSKHEIGPRHSTRQHACKGRNKWLQAAAAWQFSDGCWLGPHTCAVQRGMAGLRQCAAMRTRRTHTAVARAQRIAASAAARACCC